KDIAGWQRGDMTHNKAMAMTVTETQYKKGAEIIGLTITQGAGAMGGALAQLGMMGGGNRVRLGSHSGMLIPGEGLMISLPGGKMINLTGVPASDASLKALARKLPLDKLAAN
ncbi:MAG: hypothetical protein OIF38_06670, partial [Cellvibrionaceae bacterium]|nr:hypothetical protein [Cellvibrionaceae bacterium]